MDSNSLSQTVQNTQRELKLDTAGPSSLDVSVMTTQDLSKLNTVDPVQSQLETGSEIKSISVDPAGIDI